MAETATACITSGGPEIEVVVDETVVVVDETVVEVPVVVVDVTLVVVLVSEVVVLVTEVVVVLVMVVVVYVGRPRPSHWAYGFAGIRAATCFATSERNVSQKSIFGSMERGSFDGPMIPITLVRFECCSSKKFRL